MCITKLIERLNELFDEHGDCAVEVRNVAGDFDFVIDAVYYEDGRNIPTILLEC